VIVLFIADVQFIYLFQWPIMSIDYM